MQVSPTYPIARRAAAAMAAVAASLALPAGGLAQTETVRLSGSTVAIFNLAGQVSVSRGSGSDVAVTIRRQGADAGRLDVRSGSLDLGRDDWGRVETLRVIYPGDRIRYDGMRGTTELRVQDDGTFWGGRGNRRSGRRVEISDRGRGLEASADLDVSVPSGRRVLIVLAAGTMEARNVDGALYLDTGSGDIVTSGTSGLLNLDTGSGNVTVDRAEGEVTIDTGSGTVEVRSVRGPALSVDTGSGDVTVAEADASEIEVDTGSGDVTLLAVRSGRVGVDTGSGSVTVETVAGSASVAVDTGSGDVVVSVPADYAGDVHLETSSGSLHTDVPISLLRKGDDEIQGRIGEGGSSRIQVDTGSGDISIRRS